MINNIDTLNNNSLTNLTNIFCNEIQSDKVKNIEFNTLNGINTSQTIQEQINNLGGTDYNYNTCLLYTSDAADE